MPSLPLHTSPARPDQHHDVRSPGGYEIVRFWIRDAAQDLWIIATSSRGSATDWRYLARYAAYHRFPTRFAPPLPGGFLSTRVQVFRSTRRLAAGPATFFGADGTLRITVDAADLAGELTLTCDASAASMDQPIGEHHHWILSPMYRARGELRIGGAGALAIDAPAFREHLFGTRPLAIDFAACSIGHACLAGRNIAFFNCTDPGRSMEFSIEPDAIAARASPALVLRNPRALERGLGWSLAVCDATAGAAQGTAARLLLKAPMVRLAR